MTGNIWSKIEERERAEELLDALKAEKKTGFFEFLRDMSALGLKNIFYGVYDAVFVMFALSAALLTALAAQEHIKLPGELTDSINGYVFAASPIIYFIFFLISYFKEKLENSFAVKMTCRYTVLHLSAFRMFAAGVVCLVVNAVAAMITAYKSETDALNIIAVAFSSLFIFALITILSLLRLGSRGAAVPAVLLAVCVALCAVPQYNNILRSIPAAAYIILGFIALAAYQKILISIDRRYGYVIR